MPFLRIENISFSYDQQPVFREFSSAFSSNVVLRGPSGCGKTTLLKLIAGILKPSHGLIEINSLRTVLLTQEDALFPWLTGIENIKKILRISDQEIKSSPLYNRFREYLFKPAFQMSFGQKRILEIARALLYKPTLLCLDEPLNFIDPNTRNQIQEILLNQQFVDENTLLIISSHDKFDFQYKGIRELNFNGNLPVSNLNETHNDA